jgi:tetratricopeptide (TPR) repeat protein
VQDYATLLARYADKPGEAISELETAITKPAARKDFVGQCKLQLGDYHTLLGNTWEASLIYTQVQKEFREDLLGEEARFRDAKLAYYRGDFDWANIQVSVLKASTSELIANDALYLSVLITENIPPDSNYVPLERFAYADLLLFQNKDREAEQVLDSIAKAFPEHPLADDIMMQRAKIARKRGDYPAALSYLQQIHKEHGKDVLADDALFTMAEINQNQLNKKEEAAKLYTQLIIEYPGSTYVQLARKKVKELGTVTPL